MKQERGAADKSLEAISTYELMRRPRYPQGLTLDDRTHWTRPDTVALKAMAEQGRDIERSAICLGRSPLPLVWKAYREGLGIPNHWKSVLPKRKPSIDRGARLQYPYISEVTGEHADLIEVNRLVPRGMPFDLRGDVCQEIMLAICEERVTIQELRDSPATMTKFLRKVRKENLEFNGYAFSLDGPMRDGRSWYDIISSDEWTVATPTRGHRFVIKRSL